MNQNRFLIIFFILIKKIELKAIQPKYIFCALADLLNKQTHQKKQGLVLTFQMVFVSRVIAKKFDLSYRIRQ